VLTDDGKSMRLVAQQGLPAHVQNAERLVARDCGMCGAASAGDVLGWVNDVKTCAKHSDHDYFGVQCQRVLAIFSGPHAYISPRWYEAEHVVPTWNYVAVHVTGILQRIDDAASLAQIVSRMTDSYERSLPDPWSFDPATTFVERMVSQIVGFRIEIERIEGKWKMSQNHPVERHTKVIAALRCQAHPDSMAVADLMQSRLDQLESPQATT
jgi:predicted FMN-binding regulatory protein PaiB